MTTTAELTMLRSYLDAQRQHVLGILDGLDDVALLRPVLPSGWSCAGLVQHLALDVERFWFRCVVGGEQQAIDSLDAIEDAWQVAEDVTPSTVLQLYRDEVERADTVLAAASPDQPPAWWPQDLFGDWRMQDLRQVILHVTVETACHAGHLDAARELIDERQWMVLS